MAKIVRVGLVCRCKTDSWLLTSLSRGRPQPGLPGDKNDLFVVEFRFGNNETHIYVSLTVFNHNHTPQPGLPGDKNDLFVTEFREKHDRI